MRRIPHRQSTAAFALACWPASAPCRGHSHCEGAPSANGRGTEGAASAGGLARPRNFRIGFCTDVEGNRQYWARYLARSEVLERNASGRITLRPDCHFVFGGDAVDKGDGDLEFLQEVVELKRQYRDGVRLLIGNRDANKLRLVQELSEEYLSIPCRPVWMSHLTKAPLPRADASAAERLRWILYETMGARKPDAFELRRAELARLRGTGGPITDDDVVQSFQSMGAPGGLMEAYLSLGEIAAHYEEGALFVHGAVDANNIGVLPFEAGQPPGKESPPRLELPEW